MNKTIAYTIGIIVIIGAGAITITTQNNQTRVNEEVPKTINMQSENKTILSENKAVGMPATTTKEVTITKQGEYKDYSPENIATAQQNGQKVVLFFHAPWCPYCKAADTAFKAGTDKISSGVTILKTDYDTQKELKNKYGVTYQHTFVQIDTQGNQVAKWVSGDIEALTKNIK